MSFLLTLRRFSAHSSGESLAKPRIRSRMPPGLTSSSSNTLSFSDFRAFLPALSEACRIAAAGRGFAALARPLRLSMPRSFSRYCALRVASRKKRWK